MALLANEFITNSYLPQRETMTSEKWNKSLVTLDVLANIIATAQQAVPPQAPPWTYAQDAAYWSQHQMRYLRMSYGIELVPYTAAAIERAIIEKITAPDCVHAQSSLPNLRGIPPNDERCLAFINNLCEDFLTLSLDQKQEKTEHV